MSIESGTSSTGTRSITAICEHARCKPAFFSLDLTSAVFGDYIDDGDQIQIELSGRH